MKDWQTCEDAPTPPNRRIVGLASLGWPRNLARGELRSHRVKSVAKNLVEGPGAVLAVEGLRREAGGADGNHRYHPQPRFPLSRSGSRDPSAPCESGIERFGLAEAGFEQTRLVVFRCQQRQAVPDGGVRLFDLRRIGAGC